ncbi:MAG TPA: C13 family peptidase [Micropepsaceae bacterium]|nr:C13 family peptidase [Micropepsaceae bacterium]
MRGLLWSIVAFGSMLVQPAVAGPFDDWAAMVIAGDWHAHSGAPSEVFDNARRDLAKDLEQMGFAPSHIQQYSAHPEADSAIKPFHADPATMGANFRKLAQQANGGCLIYLTSHGAALGVAMGDALVPIRTFGDLVDETCPDRPTIVIVSACYSGMFIPVMLAPNRMIITAARGDRTSFGCSEDLKYTFFDQCVLETLPKVTTFPALYDMAKECVAAREMMEKVSPPSEPQVYIGAGIEKQLPMLTFAVKNQ